MTISDLVLLYWGILDRALARKFREVFESEVEVLEILGPAYLLFGDSFHGVLRAPRFLWSIQSWKGILFSSKKCLHVRRAH